MQSVVATFIWKGFFIEDPIFFIIWEGFFFGATIFLLCSSWCKLYFHSDQRNKERYFVA